ncbi:MAG: phospholipase D family protein [Halopseudomonas sp.]
MHRATTLSARARTLCISISVIVLSGCATTDFNVEKAESQAIAISQTTTLGQHTLAWHQQHGEHKSAFYPLKSGIDALGARLRLIEAAEQSIDLQYFLMKDDIVGSLVSAKLLEAADRGVRVRFLLDDIFTSVTDNDLYLLDAHQNIEVRLFNPIARRGFKGLNYLGDFSQANRRMHNKSFTVDGSLTIVGGRNIAAEYFNLKQDAKFFDLDMLVKGAVVKEVAESFDQFWNHSKALPIEYLNNPPSSKALEQVQNKIETVMQNAGTTVYQTAIDSQLLNDLIQQRIAEFIASAYVISESPNKVDYSLNDDSIRLIKQIAEFMLQAEDNIIIFTPYFIPTSQGMAFWQRVIDNGAQVSLVTNSLASTNHVPVHAAYEGYRKDLLAMGFNIYEARPDAAQIIKAADQTSTLHTKLIIIDNRYVFVGSLNLDPRSVIINTEMGILIDSSDLAESILDDRDSIFERVVYRLQLTADRDIQWHGSDSGKAVILDTEPQTSWWRRLTAKLYKILPEGQL